MPSAGVGLFDLRLETDGDWDIEAIAPGVWSSAASRRIPSIRPEGALVLFVAPSASATGELVLDRGQVVDEIELRFWSYAQGPAAVLDPGLLQRCPVRGGRLTCAIPAGTWDLRVGARGFVPRYQWETRVPPGGTLALGALRLQRGSSVSGRLLAERGAGPVEGVAVRLRPAVAAAPASARQETGLARRALQAASASNGAFQILGVPPGTYEVVAESPSGARATFAPVQVFADAESSLERPLVLALPVRSTIWISPPTDPLGEPWQLELRQRDPFDATSRTLLPRAPVDQGRIEVGPLAPGSYVAVVTDHRRTLRSEQPFELTAAGDPVELAIDWLRVHGRVSLGGAPLAATLHFGGRQGAERVEMVADEAGAFEGVLPRAGRWYVEVAAADPPIERRLSRVEVRRRPGRDEAELDLELPGGAIDGRVLGPDDEPVAAARVRASQPDDPLAGFDAVTDAGGRFRLEGIETGSQWVQARAEVGESRPLLVAVPEESPATVTLRLEARRTVEGVVLGDFGPVAGAMVAADDGAGGGARVPTGVDGRFSLRLKKSATSATLVVLPPGHALSVFAGVPLDDSPLTLQVSAVGGDLLLDFSVEVPEGEPGGFLVEKEGAILDVELLYRWSAANGGKSLFDVGPNETRLLVPRLEPGTYRLCSPPGSIRALRLALDPARCATAFVAPGARVSVALPGG